MIAMETLNMTPQLRNRPAKPSDENPNALSRGSDRETDFGKLLKQEAVSDDMNKDAEDADAIENQDTENLTEGRFITMPLQMNIGDTVLARTVFAQQGQKTDSRLLKAEMFEITGDEATGDSDNTSDSDTHGMRVKGKIAVAGQDRALFARGADNGGKEHGLQQDISVSVNADTQADSAMAGKDDATNGGHSRPAVLRTFSSDAIDTGFGKTDMAKPLEIGDKIQLKADSAAVSQQSRIEGLEVVQSKKSGDLRILHLKLMPENLGSIEARMRMTANGLHIELQAERAETARSLASDHRMLAQALEKSGFQDHGRISVAVVERAAHTVHAGSATAQTGDQAFGGGHQEGQETGPDSQASGQGGRGFSDDSQKGFPFADRKTDDLKSDDNAYHDPHCLVI